MHKRIENEIPEKQRDYLLFSLRLVLNSLMLMSTRIPRLRYWQLKIRNENPFHMFLLLDFLWKMRRGRMELIRRRQGKKTPWTPFTPSLPYPIEGVSYWEGWECQVLMMFLWFALELVFNEHKRTVNRIKFHPVESSLLLSAGQDGTMRCFVSMQESSGLLLFLNV